MTRRRLYGILMGTHCVLNCALLIAGASAGCAGKIPEESVSGVVPQLLEPTPEPMDLGYIGTMPPDVELRTEGIVPIEEPTPEPEELTLSGDVMIDDDFS